MKTALNDVLYSTLKALGGLFTFELLFRLYSQCLNVSYEGLLF